MKNKKELVLLVVGLVCLVLITVGVTYAFFNYAKEGTTDNTITTGTITFLYTEISDVGRGISIEDAYPVSDSVGKAQTGEGKVFDFKVTSNTPNSSSISYEVTARKKDISDLSEDAVKLYLTKVTGDTEEEIILAKYSELTTTDTVDSSKYNEKTLYKGKVPANTTDYEQAFRLRMWVDEKVDFSVGDMNAKEFTVTVNVYANAKVVTEEDTLLAANANITSVTVNGEELTQVTDQEYDYEITLDEGTTSTSVIVETENPYSKVDIEKVDSLAYNEANIKRLSTIKSVELDPGYNYFKITVTSEDESATNIYNLRIKVKQGEILLSQAIFNKYKTIYDNPTLTNTSSASGDPDGLYVSYDTNKDENGKYPPTYYFRGAVDNNYVDFAGKTWRIVRINEDGTIRLIMQNGITNTTGFNAARYGYKNTYYSNGITNGAAYQLNKWYQTNITDQGYSDDVAAGDYFCEQAKAKSASSYTTGNATSLVYTSYTPDFTCETDGNDKGIINSNIGLITYDELVYAGGYYNKSNSTYYLNNQKNCYTMSPDGVNSNSYARIWIIKSDGSIAVSTPEVTSSAPFRAVINLKSTVTVTGSGSSDDHWVVQ